MSTPGVPYKFETESLKEITKPSDYPAGKSYAIQFFIRDSIYHEGDERSRQCPGHGYPAWTENRLTIRTFVTRHEDEWYEALTTLYAADKGRTDIAAFTMERATIETRVEVRVK